MHADLLPPLFVMVGLTISVLLSLATARYIATKNREFNPKYYKLYRGDDEPAHIRQISRNFTNLCETPILFYLGVVLSLVLTIDDLVLVYFAWVYVICRIIHSLIHCTTNNVMMRFIIYVISIILLIAYWVKLGLNIWS